VRRVRAQRQVRRRQAHDGDHRDEAAQVANAIRAGANEYIMKPFSRQAVAEKLVLLGFTLRKASMRKITGQNLGDETPHGCGVIHDQDSDLTHARLAGA